MRIPEPTWVAFGELAERLGTDRSALIRAFVGWYIREAGAKLPPRP